MYNKQLESPQTQNIQDAMNQADWYGLLSIKLISRDYQINY